MRLFADSAVVIPSGKRQLAPGNPDQAGDHPKERRFACTVPARHQQRLAGGHGKIQVAKYRPAAPLAAQCACGKRQGISHLLTLPGGVLCPASNCHALMHWFIWQIAKKDFINRSLDLFSPGLF
jgi:hypothetical protein